MVIDSLADNAPPLGRPLPLPRPLGQVVFPRVGGRRRLVDRDRDRRLLLLLLLLRLGRLVRGRVGFPLVPPLPRRLVLLPPRPFWFSSPLPGSTSVVVDVMADLSALEDILTRSSLAALLSRLRAVKLFLLVHLK